MLDNKIINPKPSHMKRSLLKKNSIQGIIYIIFNIFRTN